MITCGILVLFVYDFVACPLTFVVGYFGFKIVTVCFLGSCGYLQLRGAGW